MGPDRSAPDGRGKRGGKGAEVGKRGQGKRETAVISRRGWERGRVGEMIDMVTLQNDFTDSSPSKLIRFKILNGTSYANRKRISSLSFLLAILLPMQPHTSQREIPVLSQYHFSHSNCVCLFAH